MEGTEQAAEAIAHEINNVLMTIGLSVEILREQCAESEKTERLVKMALESLQRGASLNQQLLNLARKRCHDKDTDSECA